jgi:hypothetical protein
MDECPPEGMVTVDRWASSINEHQQQQQISLWIESSMKRRSELFAQKLFRFFFSATK